jgi:hypothetical protein
MLLDPNGDTYPLQFLGTTPAAYRFSDTETDF